jgi:hypothetical protein
MAVTDTGDVGLPAGDYSSLFTCPAGKIAIGGGAADDTTFANLKIDGGRNAGAYASNTPNNQWQIFISLTTAGTDQIDGQQVCVNPPVGNSAPVAGSETVVTSAKWVKIN